MRILHALILYLVIAVCFINANTIKLQISSDHIINSIRNELGYFRIKCDTRFTKASQTNNNSVLTVRVSSRRNNYEQVLIMSLGCIGRYFKRQLNHAVRLKTSTYIPSIVTIECETPVGRDKTILSCTLNNKILIQFSEGTITSNELWTTIKSSVRSSMDFTIPDRSPNLFMADIDYENMISTRIALEGKNNPRLSKIISAALNASWVPGLESQLENMLVSHLKSTHYELMKKVMGHKLDDKQMVRIGKQFFLHIQKPYDEIRQSHSRDSLKYVWKGNTYPEDLDQYYLSYRLKHGL